MTIEVTPLLKDTIILLGAKRTMLSACRDSLRTVVVGSSHGDFGFDPAYCPDSFNLSCRSQDLKHSFYLYRRMIELCPKLENVVIYYSIFSPGNVLEKSPSEKEICPAINELFGLNLEYEDELLKVLSHNIKGKLDDFAIELEGRNGFLPVAGKGFFPADFGAENRVRDHIRFNPGNEGNIYLLRIILLARHHGHKVCVVVPPVRSDYRKAIGMETRRIFRSLYDILYNYHIDYPVELLNCFDSAEFSDADFGDYDHLLPQGPGTKLLSGKVCSAIYNTDAASGMPRQD